MVRFMVRCALPIVLLSHFVAEAVQFEFVPRNPAPGVPFEIRVTESPPGCLGELRGSGPSSRNIFFFTFLIDSLSAPGGVVGYPIPANSPVGLAAMIFLVAAAALLVLRRWKPRA